MFADSLAIRPLDGVEIEFDPQAHVLLLRNDDRPASSAPSLAVRRRRRQHRGLRARCGLAMARPRAAITVDREVTDDQLAALRATPGILSLQQV